MRNFQEGYFSTIGALNKYPFAGLSIAIEPAYFFISPNHWKKGFGKNLKQSIGIELNSNRHKIAQQTLKNIRNNIKGGKRKNIKFINDTLFNKNYFNYDIYFISNLCFNGPEEELVLTENSQPCIQTFQH